MSCPNCFSGHVNTGTPKGREEKVFDRDCYIAEPEAGKKVKGIVVIITDAFGWQFVNNKILADHYAAMDDFKVYMPDFMDGQAAPISLLTSMNAIMEDMSIVGWLKKPYLVGSVLMSAIPYKMANDYPKSFPKITSWLEALRKTPEGDLPVGAAGFCWGGKHVVKLCSGFKTPSGRNLIDVGFTAHPSSLEVPSDIEKIRLPLAIAHAEKDMVFKPAPYEETKKILEKLKKEENVESECVQYDGATHGFAVRADDSKDEAKQAAAAEKQAVEWFAAQFAKVQR